MDMAVVMVLGAAVLSGCQRAEPAGPASKLTQKVSLNPVTVTVAPVTAREVEQRVNVVGTLFGFEDITITPKVEGRVARIYFDVGDRVAPESVLLELDSTDYKLAAEEARRALESELAKVGLSTPPPENFSIEQLPSVARAQLLMDHAERRFERTKSLFARSAASQEDFDQAQTEEQVARVNLAQTRLETQAILAAIRHRQAVVATAEQRLSESVVRAPVFHAPDAKVADRPGTMNYVVADRLVSEGEMVRAFPSAPAYELVVDDVLKLRVRVPERFASQVTLGQPVEVTVEAYPNEVFSARVTRIKPTIDPQSRTFVVEALVPNADHRLRHGGFAKASVVVREKATALTVPVTSLVSFAGVNKVFVADSGKAREVPVQLGQRHVDWIEIIGDLAPGQHVVTSGHSQLFDGAVIALRTATAADKNANLSTSENTSPGNPSPAQRQ